MVQIHQKWSQYQSDEECKEKEKQQGQQILCVVIFVKSGNTLTHSANSVRERKKRMQSLEKDRCHLDRIGSGRTRDLQDDQDNGKCFSNVLEGQRHCIDQIDIHKGAEHTSAHKCNRVDTLYFQKQQISYAHNESLDQSDHDKEHPTSEISSCRSKTGNGFVFVYFLFQDGYQDQSANPECQISVERSHSGTVIFHIIKYL